MSERRYDARQWRKDIRFVWHGEPRPDLEPQVRADMLDCLSGLERPSDLCFHTVSLTEDWEAGPTVQVWGQKRDTRFHVEYIAEAVWVPLADMEKPHD